MKAPDAKMCQDDLTRAALAAIPRPPLAEAASLCRPAPVGIESGPASPQDDALIAKLLDTAEWCDGLSGVGLPSWVRVPMREAAARLLEQQAEIVRLREEAAGWFESAHDCGEKLDAAESRAKVLHEALRELALEPQIYPFCCQLCGTDWGHDDGVETHVAGCLAAPEGSA